MRTISILCAFLLQSIASAQFETEFSPGVNRGLDNPPPVFLPQPGEATTVSDFLGDGAADLQGDTLVLASSEGVQTYQLVGAEWVLESTLVASSLSAGETFGFPLALGQHPEGPGLMLLIGETQVESGPGRVWTFERLPGETEWRFLSSFTPNGLSPGAAFGGAIDFDGRVAIIGAPYHLVPNTASSSPASVPAGLVTFYNYISSSSSWVLITFFEGDENSLLGQSVDIDNCFAVAGGPGDLDTPFGCPLPSICPGQARVYSCATPSGAWAEMVDLRENLSSSLLHPHSSFGLHVALDDRRIVVAAPLNSITGAQTGDAFVFDLQGSRWNLTARLRAASPTTSERFSLGGVAMSRNLIMVGSPLADDQQVESGVVTVFERDLNNGRWVERQEIHPSIGRSGGRFGFSIDLDGSRSVISATGVGDQGTHYLYESLKLVPCSDPGNPGTLSLGRPTPSAKIGSIYDLRVTRPPANTLVFGIIGLDDTQWAGVPLPINPSALGFGFSGCDFNASPIRIHPISVAIGGSVAWQIEIPDRVELVGLEFFMQTLWIELSGTSLVIGGAGASVISR